MDTSTVTVPPRRWGRTGPGLAAGGAALGVLLVAAFLGQLGSLFGAAFSLGQLPLLAVAVLSWWTPEGVVARRAAIVLLYAIGLLLALFTFWLAALTLADGGRALGTVATAIAGGGPLAVLAWVLALLLALPALLLLHPVRVALARVLPLDPDTPRHWLGLVALVWFATMPIAPLPLLGGRLLLEALVSSFGEDASAAGAISAHDLLYGLAWTLALAFAAVGYPQVRTFTDARVRLGLTWPGWRPILLGVLLSALMVPLFQGVDYAATALVTAMGLTPTSSAWIDRLFGRGFGMTGALAAAVSAGLGEELIWRGVIQPRYGLVLAALGFAAMHGFQYGPDGLIVVLLSGLLLGLVRRASNTTVAAVVHGGYDLWLLLGLLLGWW